MKTQSPSASKPTMPCGCGGHASPDKPCSCGCSPPSCFERPVFFAGQLLSDADLSSEQKYFREKQKLYHRTLHGHGVVCGLRLCCDVGCKGRIRVGDGYAIDCCGNDIVLCNPYVFDVIAELGKKGWLLPSEHGHRHDKEKSEKLDRDERQEERFCDIHQCFHIAICYDEVLSDFVTPFKTTCAAGAATCEPTRVNESFRIEVLKDPPRRFDPIKSLEDKVARCWSLFLEGEFGRTFKEAVKPLQHALNKTEEAGETEEHERTDFFQIFCRLKAFFQHHLDRCPDLYDCTLSEKVCELNCVGEDCRTFRDEHPIARLCKLIRQYVFECILGEMIFSCAAPCKETSVILGTVEVTNGRLTRVCNCPREYVKSFPNLFQVLVATYVGGQLCKTDGDHGECEKCCSGLDEFDFRHFIDLFSKDMSWGQLAAAAPARMLEDFIKAFTESLNIVGSQAVPAGMVSQFKDYLIPNPFDAFPAHAMAHPDPVQHKAASPAAQAVTPPSSEPNPGGTR
jgi:hypothetical protein